MHLQNGPTLQVLRINCEGDRTPYERPPTIAQLRDDLLNCRAIMTAVGTFIETTEGDDASLPLKKLLTNSNEADVAAIWLEALGEDQDDLWTGLGDNKVWVLACPDIWARWWREGLGGRSNQRH